LIASLTVVIFFGVFVGNFHSKTFFKSHDQFDGIQRIRAKIVDEGSGGSHFRFVDAQLFNNDLFDLIFN